MAIAIERAIPHPGMRLKEQALWYADVLGWPVFPVNWKTKQPYASPGFHAATTDLARIEEWWNKHVNASIGVPMGHGRWALDIDERHDGLAALRKLEETFAPLPWTVTNLTGSKDGSKHLLWREPEGLDVRKGKLCTGIDIQGLGSYIIVPCSLHKSGHCYEWEADYGPADQVLQEAPAWLLELVTRPRVPQAGTNGDEPMAYDPEQIVEEGDRNNKMYELLRPHGLAGKSREWLQEYGETVSAACYRPPMDPAEIATCVSSALAPSKFAHIVVNGKVHGPGIPLQRNTAPPGFSNTAASSAANGTAPANDVPAYWRAELFVKKNGELYPNEFNITHILRYSDHWHKPENVLWYDVLLGRHMIDNEQITKAMLVKISHWFGGAERMPMTSFSLLEECLHAQCEENKRDRIAIWLNGLPPWDGEERLDTWLIKCAHADDDDIGYTRHISRRLLLSMIARGLYPGCQYREVVVLEGPENIGKSHIVEALASKEFCIVLSMNLEAKEAHMMLQRAWLAELADLDSMNRTEETRLKAFITMEEDTYVPKYRNESISVPRRAIFVGTTNDRSYLKSLSGNTRFLPLWLPGPVDLDALRAMRDQLFAEAKHVFHASGEGWWVMPEDIQTEAATRRETRRVKNPYEVPLSIWLQDKTETTWDEIAKYWLELKTPEAWKDRSLQMQIGSALRAIGFETLDEWRPALNGGKGGKWHGWTRTNRASEDAWSF